jgi:hypothetical protein
MASFINSVPYPRDLRRRNLGDPILLLNGLSLPGSRDAVTYGTTDSRSSAQRMPYTNEDGYVLRSFGDASETPWYKTPLASAALGFTAGALLCALLKR